MTDSRLRSGHQPLDEVLGGGLPADGISIIMGLPGTGKTIIAQQYTFHNARPDRPAVYFSTLSEPLEKIVRFGQKLGFFDTSAVGTSVFYEDLALPAGRDGLAGVGDHVAAVLKQRRPGLIVIDSFKALRVLADGDADFRQFLHGLAGRLTAFPVASLWVGEYQSGEVGLSPEFAVADAIVELTAVPLGQREKRSLSVRKLRGSGFRSGQHGYRLTPDGLHLFPRLADIPAAGGYPLGDHRIPSGIPGLDPMLGGGLWPGTSTMVAGPSGSGKTVMGMHFIFGGARHGEPGVIATLQENPTQLQRMLGGLGWPVAHPAVEVMYRSPVDIYIDEWVYELLEAVQRTGARRVLLDSLLDVRVAAADETRFQEFMYSLAQRFSRQGISLLTTYEMPGAMTPPGPSGVAMSHLADNMITTGYHRDHGTLKRSLAIVKTRASRHSVDMCQFSIGPGGITLGGTATPGGEPATSHHRDTARPDSPCPPP
jgi:circadian clock protein KaiC